MLATERELATLYIYESSHMVLCTKWVNLEACGALVQCAPNMGTLLEVEIDKVSYLLKTFLFPLHHNLFSYGGTFI